MAASPSPLRALLGVLSAGVDAIEGTYEKHGLPVPSLDQPFTPGPLDFDPVAMQNSRLVIAAAYQLIASVRGPFETIQEYSTGMYASALLGLSVDVHIANVLKDAGDQGLHVKDISAQTGVAPDRLVRTLRYLATRHIFREVKPDVFANNRVSSLLIKQHSPAEIKANPETEYEGSPAAAFVSHATDECFRAAVSIPAWVRDNSEKYAAPFNMAYDTPHDLFKWYELPENHARGRRSQVAMTGGGERFPPTIFTGGFDWKSLKKDAVVVDVGAGTGSVTYLLAKEFTNPRYVVQDTAHVIEKDAPKFWEEKMPEALSQRRIELQTIDFFESQPVKNADVYFMRLVLHDWPDHKCRTILKNIRAAAAPTSKLIVFDMIMAHACEYDGPFADVSMPMKPPAPLLANLGMGGGGFITTIDIQMLNNFNGKERTVPDFIQLGNETGWKLESAKGGIIAALTFSAV